MTRTHRLLAMLCAIAATCCIAQGQGATTGGTSGSGGTSDFQASVHVTVSTIAVTPANQSQNVGVTVGFIASAMLSNGSTSDITAGATWSTSNPGIAAIVNLVAGPPTLENVNCISAGTVQIIASFGGTASGSTPFTCVAVLPPVPTPVSLTIAPVSPSISAGQAVQFTVTETYSDGSKQDVTASAVFTSGTPSIATIGPLTTTREVDCTSSGGGSSIISAVNDGLTPATSTLTCSAVLSTITIAPASPSIVAGTTLQFAATCNYSDGSSKPCVAPTWSSSIATTAAISSTGLATGLAAGTTTIKAQIGSVSGTTVLTVTAPVTPPATLSSIIVSPVSKTINVGASLPFIATGTYSDGSTANVSAQAVWTTSNAAVASLQLADCVVGTPCTATLTGTGSTPYQWTVPALASSGQIDILDYAAMPLPTRNTSHLAVTGLYKAFHIDGGLLWWIKNTLGYPSDGELYDGQWLYHWFTEDGDPADQAACIAAGFPSCFLDPFASKMFVTPVKVAPRYFTLGGSDVVVKSPSPNNFVRTTNCGVDKQPLINLGNIMGITHDSGNVNWGGSVGTVRTIEIQYYWGIANETTVPPQSGTRERYELALGFGQVVWDTSHWNGSGWTVDQTSTDNVVVAGGAPTPNFACKLPALPLDGALPPGIISTARPQLNLADNTGVISGTPNTPGTYPVTVQQEDAGGTFHIQPQTIRVNATAGTAQQTVNGLTAGSATITATIGAISNGTTLTVQTPAPTLSSIAVTPVNPIQVNGLTKTFTAMGTYSDGSVLNITGSATWTSGTPATATMSANVALCVTGGGATSVITAAFQSKSGTSTLTCTTPTPTLSSIAVTPASPTVTTPNFIGFTATGTYSDASTQNLTSVASWSSGTPGVATVGPLSATESGNCKSAGTSVIQATFTAVSGNTTLTCNAPAITLSSIAVVLVPSTQMIGQASAATATCTYSDASTANCTTSATWTSGTPGTATIGALTSTQAVNCIAAGTSSIQAAIGAVNQSATETCQAAVTLTSIAVTPANPTQYNGSTVQFTATGTYSNGTTQNLTSQVAWVSGTPAVATIGAATGLATCVANSGSSTVTATLSAVSGNTSLTCQTPTTNTGGNAYCTPAGTWIGPTTDGAAAMPTACMNTALSNTPSPGTVRGPDTLTSQVQADINAAACGDVIQVAAGSTIGTITLPAKGCNLTHWITIESTGVSNVNFPAEGTRMTPCWSGVASLPGRPAYTCPSPAVLTFTISAPLAGNAIVVNGDHYRIIGAKITRNQAPGIVFALVTLPGSAAPFPNNLILDRVWGAGVEGTFPQNTSTSTETKRFLDLGQSNHVALIDSYVTNMYCDGSISACDSQVIGGGFGSTANSGWGVYKMTNTHAEAAAEGMLIGGANGPPLTPAGCTITVNCNQDAPTDFEIRGNYFFKPLQWNGNTTTVNTVGWPLVKNGFEMKTGVRALFEGNVIENCWFSAQGCGSFNVAPINQQSGGSSPTPTCPTCVVKDFTYRFNYSYNTAYGIAVYSFTPTTCSTCQSQGMNRVNIHDNVIGDNMNMGSLTGLNSGDAIEILADNDPSNRGLNKTQNLTISHNTFVKDIRSMILFGGPTSNAQIVNLTMQNNIWSYGNFGFVSVGNSGGCDTVAGGSFFAALNNCTTGFTVDHDAEFNVIGTLGRNWPTNGSGLGNFFYTGTAGPGFTNYGTGNSNFTPSNYQLLTSSPLHNAGSDGKDLGADIVTLTQKIAGVRQ